MAVTLVGSPVVSTNFNVAAVNNVKDTAATITWLTGDLICVWGFTGDNATTLTLPVITGLTLSNVLTSNIASRGKLYLWTATAASGGTNVACTGTANANVEGGYVVKVWRGASGFGTISSLGSGTTGAATVSYTISAVGSLLDGGWVNWNQNTGARTYLTTNLGTATEDHSYNSATYATSGTWHNAATTATGSQTIGMSAPTLDAWLIAGIEILAGAVAGGGTASTFNPIPFMGGQNLG